MRIIIDNEISFFADITPTGVQGKAKARTFSGIDRLFGNCFDFLNIPIEAKVARKRAESSIETNFIEAIGKKAIKRLEADPDFADKAIENFYGTAVRRYKNKSEVVREAFKSLEHEPPSHGQTSSGPEVLDESFLNRFERYAEEASTEELHVKWGKVLAAEVKKPGTFSAKVMRIVDELEPLTAQLSERICKYRIDRTILICLAGNLQFTEEITLIAAGLLIDSNTGTVRNFSYKKDSNGIELWYMQMGKFSVAIPKSTKIEMSISKTDHPIQRISSTNNDGPFIPVYILTDAGFAIASILEDKQEETFCSYIKCLSQFLPSVPVNEYHQVNDKMHCVKIWRDGTMIV